MDKLNGFRNFNRAFIDHGSTNLRTSSFVDHGNSDMHNRAMLLLKKGVSKDVCEWTLSDWDTWLESDNPTADTSYLYVHFCLYSYLLKKIQYAPVLNVRLTFLVKTSLLCQEIWSW